MLYRVLATGKILLVEFKSHFAAVFISSHNMLLLSATEKRANLRYTTVTYHLVNQLLVTSKTIIPTITTRNEPLLNT